MTAFIGRRLIQALVVLIVVTMLVFIIIRLLPGDPILIYVSQQDQQSLSEEDLQAARHEFGLDKPFILQYVDWISGVFRGDLGTSLFYREKVGVLIAERIPITLNIGLIAWVLGGFLGILAGVVAAVRRGTRTDTIITVLSYFGVTIPIFWLGVLLLYFFGLQLKWLPVFGYIPPSAGLIDNIKSIILPVCCLAVVPLASITRQTRSSMLEVIRQDYIRTAWAKGLKENVIILRHALKNGLIPVITLLGISLSLILGGSVLTETVFNIPGMGRLAVDALMSKDYAIIQAVILIVATMVVFVNLIVDIAYGWLDPRIRFS
jgi:peptide/nickel transport system permease protein